MGKIIAIIIAVLLFAAALVDPANVQFWGGL